MKTALELLFWKGDLMITERRNFHRIYDLTERVLPDNTDTTLPSMEERGRFLVLRALGAYGIAQEKEIRGHLHSGKEVINKALSQMVEIGEVVTVSIGKDDNSIYFTLPEIIERSTKLRRKSPGIHILSPFDNLIILRDRIKKLFGFDYALECYVPAKKREYGYFVLPILWGERFAGRLDPKADRKKKTMLIRNLVFEEDFEPPDEFLTSFAEKLSEFARFNNCEKITLEKVTPEKMKPVLLCSLKGV